MSYGILAFLNIIEKLIMFKIWILGRKITVIFKKLKITLVNFLLPGGEFMSPRSCILSQFVLSVVRGSCLRVSIGKSL